MKAFLIAFAAVVTAAWAPQTGPFKRLLAPEPTVPHEEPVTDAELLEPCVEPASQADPKKTTARRGGRDRSDRRLFKRFRSRQSKDPQLRRQHSCRRFSRSDFQKRDAETASPSRRSS